MAGERVQFMRAEIIAIGSELVSGQGLDTNSQWLSRALEAHGIPVALHTTIGDQLDDHVSTFRIAAGRAELVIMTGELGPTTFACLPGIPSEMKVMFHEHVLPRLRRRGWINRIIIERKINLFGR